MEQYDLDYLLKNQIVFVEEYWTEEPVDYWFVYYEDEDCTIEIENIDDFVISYNKKVKKWN